MLYTSIAGVGKHRLKTYIQSCAISEQSILGLVHTERKWKQKREISKKNDKHQREIFTYASAFVRCK